MNKPAALAVDDDRLLCVVLSAVLELDGFEGPVVIVSGSGAVKAQRDLGVEASLEKPFKLEELVEVVHHALEGAA